MSGLYTAISLIDPFVWSYQVTADCQCNTVAGEAGVVAAKLRAALWNSTVLHADAHVVGPEAGFLSQVDLPIRSGVQTFVPDRRIAQETDWRRSAQSRYRGVSADNVLWFCIVAE